QDVDPQTGEFKNTGPVTEDGWRTIDKVRNPETHDFYSSKPPLLTTLVAGEYWLLKKAFGWSIVDQRWEVVPTILLTVNALPIVTYGVLWAVLLEGSGTRDGGPVFPLPAACFGTFVTTFATTLNNHPFAACSAMSGLYAALRIWTGDASPAQFILAGLWAGFTA